ncbi:MAG: hypothetical protein LKCHEGNO_01320 [Burkholderiaceae bacterium]|nr:hypothetical protein [Burkholderiaceae bacterium]
MRGPIIDGMTSPSSIDAARPGALVVIGGGTSMPHHHSAHAERTAQAKLRSSLPAAARVLAWHRDAGLRQAYQIEHPASEWQSFDDEGSLRDCSGVFDLIVLGQGLDPFDDPAAVLKALRSRAHARTALALNLAHDASLAMLQRFVEADLTDSADGPLAGRPLRHRSLASATKLLMDAGWMPTLADAVWDEPRHDAVAQSALALAAAVGVPAATAQRQWRMQRAIVHASAPFDDTAQPGEAPVRPDQASIAVVVPTTRDAQLRVNVECSPGLQEIGARVISVRRAGSAADALQHALPHLHEDWVLLCHQDVYFARGFGKRLAALLAGIQAPQRPRTLIGFAGIAVNASTNGYEHAGFVIDRTHRFDNPGSDTATSIDELALVLPRESPLRIDSTLGWHLWATDLCLQAICTHRFFPRIVRLPLFHNSHTDHTLPAAFHRSAASLCAKYSDFGPIHTLCGVIDEASLARSRSPAT